MTGFCFLGENPGYAIAERDGTEPVKPTERTFARRIDLTSLQLFVAVCELGSIGKAAEREFIAASAVSKRLSDLEAALDAPLLYRHARGVDLTPAGQSLLHHARSVLFGLEQMQAELSEDADRGCLSGSNRWRPNSPNSAAACAAMFVFTATSPGWCNSLPRAWAASCASTGK